MPCCRNRSKYTKTTASPTPPWPDPATGSPPPISQTAGCFPPPPCIEPAERFYYRLGAGRISQASSSKRECIPDMEFSRKIPHKECSKLHFFRVSVRSLEKQLAAFLKKERGQTSYAEFSKRTGLTPSTLFRLENCQQSITIGRLEQVMNRLKVTLWDIFGD